MRSQQEIINKINEIRKSNADPMKVQVRMLIRKLNFSTAKDLLPVKVSMDPNIRNTWDKTSCLDKKFLIGEIGELMYQAYDAVIEDDLKKMIIFHQVFLIFAWLLNDDILMRELISKFQAGEKVPVRFKRFLFKGIFDLICDNFGLRIQTYCQDWELGDNPDVNQEEGGNGKIISDV